MRRYFFFSILLFCSCLAACRPGLAAAPGGGELRKPVANQSATPLSGLPRFAPKTPVLERSNDSTATVVPTATIQPSPTSAPAFTVCSPLEPHPLEILPEIISDPYRPPPENRKEERHHGVDFAHYRRGDLLSIEGVGVQSVLPGRVAASLVESYPYGNVVIIETTVQELPTGLAMRLGMNGSDSLYVLYAHLQEPPLVSLGERVSACQAIGKVGKSGNAGGVHLHLETRLGPPGISLPGMRYYKIEATSEERDAYVRWRTGGEFRHFDPLELLLPGQDKVKLKE
jgi:murein DD-endopeptidase MepM/ murein hydrolase activator NlpD